jgi:hypothetical protein
LSMSFAKDNDQEAIIKRRIKELKNTQCTTETDELVTSATLETALSGADNSDGKPTPEQLAFYEENKGRVGEAIMVQVDDNGFSILQADEYLAVRTKPMLEGIYSRMPPLSRKKKALHTLVYLSTGASVLLGTIGMDLYIAISTGIVSLLTGIIEYQKVSLFTTSSVHPRVWMQPISGIFLSSLFRMVARYSSRRPL